MDAIYNVFGCKIKLFHGVFSLNCGMISTDNKIRNENPASTGLLAGLKRFFSTFHLSSTCTNEPAANLLHQSRHVEIDAAGSWPGFPQQKSKACCKPAWTCRKSVRKPGRKPGFRPGLQLPGIMECGLMQARYMQHILPFYNVWSVAQFLCDNSACSYIYWACWCDCSVEKKYNIRVNTGMIHSSVFMLWQLTCPAFLMLRPVLASFCSNTHTPTIHSCT